MKTVTTIKIGDKLIPIDESALERLNAYLANLKHRYSDEVQQNELLSGAEERIANMMAQIIRTEPSVTDADVEKILNELDHTTLTSEVSVEVSPHTPGQKNGLKRNSDDQLLGGICSGIADYVQVDPSLIRILGILFCLSIWGIFLYLALWIILPSEPLGNFTGKRITRKLENRYLGGVASGISSYFDWNLALVRLAFLTPLIINLVLGVFSWPFLWAGFWIGNFIFHSSITGTFIIAYLTLWVILPASSASPANDEAATSIAHSFGWIARVIIFFIAGVAIFALFVVLVPLLILGSAIWPLNNFAWTSIWQQYFAYASLFLFLGVPFCGFLVWVVRRMIGAKSGSIQLRWTFGVLWLLGWVSLILFVVSTFRDFKPS